MALLVRVCLVLPSFSPVTPCFAYITLRIGRYLTNVVADKKNCLITRLINNVLLWGAGAGGRDAAYKSTRGWAQEIRAQVESLGLA